MSENKDYRECHKNKGYKECYENRFFSVAFNDLPSIKLLSVNTDPEVHFIRRVSIATKRRYFSLRKPWKIKLGKIEYKKELNGVIAIPMFIGDKSKCKCLCDCSDHDMCTKPILFDGASIPLPWFVSLLTLGILRPLGVMLIASIVHDFAYKYGYLPVYRTLENGEESEECEHIEVERHVADLLLQDIISTANGMPVVGFIARIFVRFGWLFVPYNGELRKGRIPFFEIGSVVLAISLIIILMASYPLKTLAAFGIAYMSMYVLSVFFNTYHPPQTTCHLPKSTKPDDKKPSDDDT